MAELFEKMAKTNHADEDMSDDETEDNAGEPRNDNDAYTESLEYLSSHPSDKERIARLKAADAER